MTTDPIAAPDGVVAHLLAFADGAATSPNDEAEAWLEANGLIARDPATGVLVLTARGSAWGGMILATPLPVEVHQWADPRDGKGAPQKGGDYSELVDALRMAIAGAGQRTVLAPTARPGGAPSAPAAIAPADGVQILPGFSANNYTATEKGQAPAGLQRDTDVIIQLASGRVLGEKRPLMASQVIWQITGNPNSDVLAYRLAPTVALSDTALTSSGG